MIPKVKTLPKWARVWVRVDKSIPTKWLQFYLKSSGLAALRKEILHALPPSNS
jgi:hypothetical protein